MKHKCYCNVCKKRRELGLDDPHVIVDYGNKTLVIVRPIKSNYRFKRRLRQLMEVDDGRD